MKFVSLLAVLVATASYAQPVEERDVEASFAPARLLQEHAHVQSRDLAQLLKRSDASFTGYTDSCMT